MRTLATRAIDAARSAGAAYADARLIRTVSQGFNAWSRGPVMDNELLDVGVRVMADGAWGFAASPYWNADEVVRLAQDAVQQAHDNALGAPRTVDLGTYPVASGEWTTPIRIDPFAVPLEEKIDFMRSWVDFADRYAPSTPFRSGGLDMTFKRQERAVATTEGAVFFQTLFESGGQYSVRGGESRGWRNASLRVRGLGMARRGWELFLDANIREQIPSLAEQIAELSALSGKPMELGRYTVLFDGATTADLLDKTIGMATELDRAMGYEANVGGTSYLSPPLDLLGGAPIAASPVTMTANRSVEGGLATVHWDDEGVEPEDFTVVNQGVLADYQTTREQVGWLAPWYEKQGRPVRSHGCAWTDRAITIPMQHSPNLALAPAGTDTGLADLVAGVETGVAVFGMSVGTDARGASGWGSDGYIREIRDGKLGAIVTDGGLLFTTEELWKNVVTLGGASTVESVAATRSKGQPGQQGSHTVSAPAMVVRDVTFTNQVRGR